MLITRPQRRQQETGPVSESRTLGEKRMIRVSLKVVVASLFQLVNNPVIDGVRREIRRLPGPNGQRFPRYWRQPLQICQNRLQIQSYPPGDGPVVDVTTINVSLARRMGHSGLVSLAQRPPEPSQRASKPHLLRSGRVHQPGRAAPSLWTRPSPGSDQHALPLRAFANPSTNKRTNQNRCRWEEPPPCSLPGLYAAPPCLKSINISV